MQTQRMTVVDTWEMLAFSLAIGVVRYRESQARESALWFIEMKEPLKCFLNKKNISDIKKVNYPIISCHFWMLLLAHSPT